MKGSAWLSELRSKLDYIQLHWLDTDESNEAIMARWLELLIEAECEESRHLLEELLEKVENINDYYAEYKVEDPNKQMAFSLWDLLQKAIGKKIYTNIIKTESYELIGILPIYNAILVRTKTFEGILLLNSGLSICWEREE